MQDLSSESANYNIPQVPVVTIKLFLAVTIKAAFDTEITDEFVSSVGESDFSDCILDILITG